VTPITLLSRAPIYNDNSVSILLLAALKLVKGLVVGGPRSISM